MIINLLKKTVIIIHSVLVKGVPPQLASVSGPVGGVQPGQTVLAVQRFDGTPLGPGSAHCQHYR